MKIAISLLACVALANAHCKWILSYLSFQTFNFTIAVTMQYMWVNNVRVSTVHLTLLLKRNNSL